jgi:hypothetical protein
LLREPTQKRTFKRLNWRTPDDRPATGEYAVIAPGHNFKSVTQKIAGIVLTPNTPLGWFGVSALPAAVATLLWSP